MGDKKLFIYLFIYLKPVRDLNELEFFIEYIWVGKIKLIAWQLDFNSEVLDLGEGDVMSLIKHL